VIILNFLKTYFEQRFLSKSFLKNKKVIRFGITDKDEEDKVSVLINRVPFYFPSYGIDVVTDKNFINLSGEKNLPIICTDSFFNFALNAGFDRDMLFNVDHESNPVDGWEWNHLLMVLTSEDKKNRLMHSKSIFRKKCRELMRNKLNRSYIFGTGPSLSDAIGMNWNDGYRIVANTIVKDPILWKHISPHILVAGDAIYHFGNTLYAESFRNDLRSRFKEDPNFIFVYPYDYDVIACREFGQYIDRLVPIPLGGHNMINVNLLSNFQLPLLGNVLPLLLLPVASTLSKEVYLWGFDGRNPKDKLFWSNSKKHSYGELMIDLQKKHPAFFANNVPVNDPLKYVKETLGEKFDLLLSNAENSGWKYIMMHKSWTPALQERFKSSC
jgi:hypothetical protein